MPISVAACHTFATNHEAFRTACQAIMADVKNYTTIGPIMQIGKVVTSLYLGALQVSL